MKAGLHDLVIERMQILIKNALSNARSNPKLAERQASLAKRLSTKYRIRMPYEMRMNFCKKCKKFIVLGFTARIRLGRSAVKSIRITCGFCNHTYRKIIKKQNPKVNDL
jgi:ribonuclease P protein subunit RPR2